jgi:hypothetical protein
MLVDNAVQAGARREPCRLVQALADRCRPDTRALAHQCFDYQTLGEGITVGRGVVLPEATAEPHHMSKKSA